MSVYQFISGIGAISALYTVFIILLRLRKGIRRREILSLGGVFAGAALIALVQTPIDPNYQLWQASVVFFTMLVTFYALIVSDRDIHFFYLVSLPIPPGVFFFLTLWGSGIDSLTADLLFLCSFIPWTGVQFILAYRYWKNWHSRVHKGLMFFLPLFLLGTILETLLWNRFRVPVGILSGVVLLHAIAGTILVLRGGYLSHRSWKEFARQFNPTKDSITERFINLARANTQSVLVLTQTIEAKDPYTRGHCIRVRDYSRAIARELGFDREHHMNLEFGSILHDVGKIGIAGIILNKRDTLTIDEYERIKKHPEIGASIIGNVESFIPVIPIVLHHHERFDGGGYPQGMEGMSIPLEARILAVADAYDAMTTDRPYRDAILQEKALKVLKDCSGTQLDPDIVECFIRNRIYDIPHNIQDRIAFEF